MTINFQTWLNNNPNSVHLEDTSLPNWKQITYGFRKIPVVDSSQAPLSKWYKDMVNMDTGDIYINKTEANMFKVNAAMILGRPLKTVLKTAYHLCLPISIPYEIYDTVQREKAREKLHPEEPKANLYKECTISVIKSLADIVRTPLYGIVLTVMHVAGAILYFIKPEKMNDVRSMAGKVDLSLSWDRKERCFPECYQSMDNLMTVHRRSYKIEGVDYSAAQNDTQIGLINLAYARAQHDKAQTKMEGPAAVRHCMTALAL